MSLIEISAILLTVTAFGSFINEKWVKLPTAIGLMLLAMIVGLLGILAKNIGLIDVFSIETFLASIDFSETIFHGMLSFLLFAGALQINFVELKHAKLPIAITASVSTLISTLLVGSCFYLLVNALGIFHLSLLESLLFGAIISPTDPIAVLAIIKKYNAPKALETKIAGESLFNDGVAIVFFIIILEQINGTEPSLMTASQYLFVEAGCGLLFGFLLGWMAYQLLLKVKTYQVVLLITLAITTAGYVLAEKLHVSAPLAMVTAGIVIGNQGRHKAMTKNTRLHIDLFWEVVDEILNAVLFVLIGLEMMTLKVNSLQAFLGLACIFIVLIARYLSLIIPIFLLQPFYRFTKGAAIMMTWGGLRGALSIAMVLALPQQHLKELFLPCVYFVVVFSIIIQGLTFNKLLTKYTSHS